MSVEVYTQFEPKHWIKGEAAPPKFATSVAEPFKSFRDIAADHIKYAELQTAFGTYTKELFSVAKSEGIEEGKSAAPTHAESNDDSGGEEKSGITKSRVFWASIASLGVGVIVGLIAWLLARNKIRHLQAENQQLVQQAAQSGQ